ncbi:MAG: hypothetical protein LBU66_03885 [Treponema sp.]|nr:hypothetical protein [Treponema sp.]
MNPKTGKGKVHNCTFAIKTDGTLWAWGNNESGELGNSKLSKRNPTPHSSWD